MARGKSEGFSRLTPSVVFLVAIAATVAGLAYAMKSLPIGTYAVWVSIGAALTVAFSMVLLLCVLIGCVMGLRLAH